jgi:hypothetical protein
MKWFDDTVAALRNHFQKVRLRAPAEKSDLDAFAAIYSSVSEELLGFFREANGMYVGIHDYEDGTLFTLQKCLETVGFLSEIDAENQYLPIRADGCGCYDCVVVGNGIKNGAVIFRDHATIGGPSYLLAGSFSSYFQMWADNLITKYHPNGDVDPKFVAPKLDKWPWLGKPERRHPWPFDESWIKSRDTKAAAILDDPQTRAWLIEQDN